MPTHLGQPRFFDEVAERTAVPGVATGLAYTAVGGDVLFVEASAAAGGRGFLMTGQLGDVMRESAQAALSYVRSRAEDLGIEPGWFAGHDLHLHVPAGATPKDGPSAGVTMATALLSHVSYTHLEFVDQQRLAILLQKSHGGQQQLSLIHI